MIYKISELSKRWFVVFECKSFLGLSFRFWNICKVGSEIRSYRTKEEAQNWINIKKK